MTTTLMVGLFLMLSLAMLAVGMMLLRQSRRQKQSEDIACRLRQDYGESGSKQQRPGAGKNRSAVWQNADVPSWLLLLGAILGLLLVLIVGVRGGWFAGLAAAAGFAALGYGWLRWRTEARVRKMVSQMPVLLDHMVRSLKSGRTFTDALLLAMERSAYPLKDALAAPRRSIELGVAPGDAMAEFATRYNSQEFHILAMGMRVNQRHGGNASELLDSLIVLIHDRERAARQLRALTGETRISALVLAVLPVGLAGYILFSNPDFILGLWNESAGRYLLLTAAAMQALGCYLLWRMLRSI